MNYIIIDKSCMSAFTDNINADDHKHWMLQLFFALENDLIINIAGKEIKCICIVVNTDIKHSFSAQNKPIFSMLIDAISPLALGLKETYLHSKNYHIFDNNRIVEMQGDALFKESITIKSYENFVFSLFEAMNIKICSNDGYHERIHKVIEQLKICDCLDHAINEIADNIFISPSRLSHHFKEQTGMPLKSYILLHMVKRAYLHLLQNGNITNAALEAGFDSPSHFAATSKKLTGMSASNISKDSVFLKAEYI